MESSFYNLPDAIRHPDVTFKSPELIHKCLNHYPIGDANRDMTDERNCANSDCDEDDRYFRRKISSDFERDEFENDCCNCNIQLRRDIERLKYQVNRIDKAMNSNMEKIVSLLEKNFSGQSNERKFGQPSTSYSEPDGQATTSV